MGDIRLDSDFKDYYDGEFNSEGSIIYSRRIRDTSPRGVALEKLRTNGVPIVPIGPANSFGREVKRLVVYADPKGHNGAGKEIMLRNDARLLYGNTLASEFIEDTHGVYIKFLQIGERRFSLTMQNPYDGVKCHPGQIISIQEIPPAYNYVIRIPIFSIDYISYKGVMAAIDFNEVQNLQELSFYRWMTPKDVANEVEKAIKTINKVK